jgi:hypothetical protein
MTRAAGLFSIALVAVLCAGPSRGDDEPSAAQPPKGKGPPKGGFGKRFSGPPAKDGMPLSGLSPAKPDIGACVYRYPVGTANATCQAFVDQGLGMYYSYVWMEASRCFETALKHDPECAYAWLMLHRSLEKWGRTGGQVTDTPFAAAIGGMVHGKLPDRVGKSAIEYTLNEAKRLVPKANPREQLLIQARLRERGMWPNTPPDDRRKLAQQALDELLMLHEDDEEAWFWRAQLADGPNGAIPFYKALLKVNPVHPGANHELVHFYENSRRPALGWPFAENYIKSSPGIPHAFHMQAHLAMRIGKWGPTTDWSWTAVQLEKKYHQYQNVKPGEDHQFAHHMETLTRSLVHDGRFAEAKQIKTEALGHRQNFRPEWLRMALTEKDWAEAKKLIDQLRPTDKAAAAYYAALMYLEQRDHAKAKAELDVLAQQRMTRRADKALERRWQEVQGRLLCQTGEPAAGLKLLKAVVDATKNDYSHHSWGNGAVLMEAWGVGALEGGHAADAAEAFQEALAHDAGSVRGALGMWAVCTRLAKNRR